jgi:hypothetical protein
MLFFHNGCGFWLPVPFLISILVLVTVVSPSFLLPSDDLTTHMLATYNTRPPWVRTLLTIIFNVQMAKIITNALIPQQTAQAQTAWGYEAD